MKEHVNFYENLREAHMRINRTVVLYDGQPYYVMAVTNHKGDGIFRVYMWEVGTEASKKFRMPDNIDHYGAEHEGLGPYLDKWLDDPINKGVPLIRKMMNSPKFNRFRPYPLGMSNNGKNAVYLERTPQRRTEQGLTRNMLKLSHCGLDSSRSIGRSDIDIIGKPLRSCILGEYPSAQECLTNLLDSAIENESAAFHRQFAFCRGPLNLVFLYYKGDAVGMLPYKNTSTLLLDPAFAYVKEAAEELGIFGNIQVQG